MNTFSPQGVTLEVPTGDIKAAQAPAFLQCLALGSCVAVILYDEKNKIGGIAHVMLPSSLASKAEDANSLKYADYAVRELLKRMKELGAEGEKLIARLVGGARVIPDAPDVGKENIEMVRSLLQELGIRIIDEHIGGEAARSVLFDVSTGTLQINGNIIVLAGESGSIHKEEKEPPEKTSEYVLGLEDQVHQRTKELNERVAELENVRKATFNLLEDLEKERDRLTEAQAKNEAMLASIGDGFAVADEKGKLVYFNKTAEDILGADANQGLPDTWQKEYGIFDPATFKPYPADQMPLFLAVKGQTVNKVQLFIRNEKMPDGKFITVTATPIIMNGKSVGGVAVFRDMTKEMQIDKAKTEFVSLASHQLRTPLTSVSWYAEMLLTGDIGHMNDEQKKYIDRVYHGNKRMVDLVNSLLNVSRIELGIFSVEPKPTNIIALAEKVILEQKPQIGAKNLHFTSSLDKNIPTISVDPNLLQMVFQNLLSNAVKYTSGGGTIEFTLSFDDMAANILLKVSDTGCGIPKNQQDKIFTKLFRADNVREKDTDGTGLGLYIVKSVVEHSGGGIRFESEENRGTAFFVTLPLEGMKKREGTKALA